MSNHKGVGMRGLFPRTVDGVRVTLPQLSELCGGVSEGILRTVVFHHPELTTSAEITEAVRRHLATPKKPFHPGRESRRWNSGINKPSEPIPDCPQRDQF